MIAVRPAPDDACVSMRGCIRRMRPPKIGTEEKEAMEMRELRGDDERIKIELSQEELEDLIGQVRTGDRLRSGHPRQQRLLAKLRGFGTPFPANDDGDDEDTSDEGLPSSVCPLERETPDDVSWLADWVHGRIHELTDGDERAVIWKQAHLIRFQLGRLHDWLEEADYPAVAAAAFQAEALAAHVARYLEHLAACPNESEGDEQHDRLSRQ